MFYSFADSWVADIDDGMDNGIFILNQNLSHNVYYPTPQSVEYNGKLYLTWAEQNSSGVSQIRVSEYDGTNWIIIDSDGENGLNFNSAQGACEPSIAVSNGVLYVSWREWSNTNPNGYTSHVSKYNGSPGNWTRIDRVDGVDGGTAYGIRINTTIQDTKPNYYTSNYLHLLDYNNTLYAVWSENAYDQTSTNVVLASYDGANWNAINTKLNTKAEAVFADMVVHNGDLYIAFEEGASCFTDSNKDIRVKKYNPATGITDVTSNSPLEYDSSINCDHKTKLASDGTNLYAVWNEKNANGKRQIQAKKYNGIAWTSIDGGEDIGVNFDITKDGFNTSAIGFNGDLYVSWYESNGTAFEQMRIKKYDPDLDTWVFVDDNGLTSGTGFSYGLNLYHEEYGVTTSSLAEYASELYLFWREDNKLYVKNMIQHGTYQLIQPI